MKKNNALIFVMCIIAIFVIVQFAEKDMMTFYDHKECLVKGTWIAGCEGSGRTTVYDIYKDPSWGQWESCTGFMVAHGCKPQNCNYEDNASCDGWNAENVLTRECNTKQECVDRFQNSAWNCGINPLSMVRECVFEGNHMKQEDIEIYGIGSQEGIVVEENNWFNNYKTGILVFTFIIIISLYFGIITTPVKGKK